MKQKIRTLSAPLSQKQYLRHPTHSLWSCHYSHTLPLPFFSLPGINKTHTRMYVYLSRAYTHKLSLLEITLRFSHHNGPEPCFRSSGIVPSQKQHDFLLKRGESLGFHCGKEKANKMSHLMHMVPLLRHTVWLSCIIFIYTNTLWEWDYCISF